MASSRASNEKNCKNSPFWFNCAIALNWGVTFLFACIMPLLYSVYAEEIAKIVTAHYLPYFQILHTWPYIKISIRSIIVK